jgi:hypothetical protein
MRTAARIALVLTGTMIVFAATAMVGARADGRTDGGNLRVTDQTEASNLPRPQPAPRPVALPDYAHAELFLALSKMARFFESAEMPDLSARKTDRSISFVADLDRLRREPAPVVIKFEGVVINVNVAGLGW